MYFKTILTISILILSLTGCSGEKEGKSEKEKIKVVKVLNLRDSDAFVKSFEFPAEIYAYQDVTMAFEVSGKIVKFNYKEGEKVKKGSVIAKLDDTIYRANYDSTKANYIQASNDYKRYEKLYTTKSVAKIELEKQKQNLDVTKAAFEVAKKHLNDTKLIAEFDGIMAKKMVDDFERVTAKQPIIRLQDNSSFKVKFFVPESDVIGINQELTPANISKIANFYVSFANSSNQTFKAKLIDISTTAEKVTRTFEATLQMSPQKGVNILPGMTAKVKAISKEVEKKSIYIPFDAVFTDDTKKSFVWVINEQNRVKKTEVKLGSLSSNSIEVLEGLDGVSKIVTSGIRFLNPNDEVKSYEKLDK